MIFHKNISANWNRNLPPLRKRLSPFLKKTKTYTYWLSLLRLVRRPTSLAQAATFLRTVEDFAPTAFIFSCIFSQTRGTPMKAVGRASFKVSTSEPCKKKKNRKIQIKITNFHNLHKKRKCERNRSRLCNRRTKEPREEPEGGAMILFCYRLKLL